MPDDTRGRSEDDALTGLSDPAENNALDESPNLFVGHGLGIEELECSSRQDIHNEITAANSPSGRLRNKEQP